ncbi:MAG: cell division protein FtsX [Flavobacteriales bacterium]
MAGKPKKNRLRGSSTSLSTVIGITLVLFVLCITGGLMIKANSLVSTIKEQLSVDILFRESAREIDIRQIEKELLAQDNVLQAKYISQDSARAMVLKMWNDSSALDLIDYNPLRAAIAINLKQAYANPDSAQIFKAKILEGNEHLIEEVHYDEAQFLTVNDGLSNLTWLFLGFSALLLLIAVALINNTIRLAIYSKRFLIRTMQLVGARSFFIKRPFIVSALYQGIVSGILAVALFITTGILLAEYNPELFMGDYGMGGGAANQIIGINLKEYGLLFAAIILTGIVISVTSTFLALRKYIRIKTDQLY